jgi:hypothetical protein
MYGIVDLSRRREDTYDVHHDELPPPAARSSPRAAPAARELPPLPDTDTHLLARATHAAHAGARRADAVRTEKQVRIDAFYERSTPTYHTPEGDARVAAPFRMLPGYDDQRKTMRTNLGETYASARKHGLKDSEVGLVLAGRGSPEQVQRLTQALIDEGHLPAADADDRDLRSRIRQMQFDHGIGFDCAGYVQQAALAAHGLDRAKAHMKTATNENLYGLESRGWTKLPVADVRAGDVMVLDSRDRREPGHTVIVASEHYATEAERAQLPADIRAQVGTSAQLRVIEVDSSWGSGGNAQKGGVDRRTLVHDETSDQWFSGGGATRGPYDHDLHGVYRPREEPRS